MKTPKTIYIIEYLDNEWLDDKKEWRLIGPTENQDIYTSSGAERCLNEWKKDSPDGKFRIAKYTRDLLYQQPKEK